MKTTSVLLLSLLLRDAAPAWADGPPSRLELTPPDARLPVAVDQRRARALEIAGATLTGVGVLTEVATIALWATAHLCFDPCPRTPREQRVDDMQWSAASATAVIAPVLLIAGLTTWAIGAQRRKALAR